MESTSPNPGHGFINTILGRKAWPDGLPDVTQGLSGKTLIEPMDNAGTPLISIILPVYNACRVNSDYLTNALTSISNQTYKNTELIIIDDGSLDDTKKVCMGFLENHPEIIARYLTKENGGQSSARNFGILACDGEYICFIDQDDEWYENKLSHVVPWLQNKGIDMLYTDADTIDGNGVVQMSCIHGTYKFGWPHPKRRIEDILFKDIFVMPGLMTVKKDVLLRIGGFDENLSGYEDDDLFLRLYEHHNIFYLPLPTLRWRMYGDNYSFSSRMLKSRTYYWRKLLKNHTNNGANKYRCGVISLRFFWQFLGQAKEQYLLRNELCWESIKGAKVIIPNLPLIQRALFSCLFVIPGKIMLPMLVKLHQLFRETPRHP